MGKVRENLSEVLLAQGYQDLTGQIIRGVMKLVGELEIVLGRPGALATATTRRCRARGRSSDETRRGFGPPIPGIETRDRR